jgi:hypothetical protein
MIKIQYLDKGAETGRELLCVCMRDVSESLYKRGRHDQDSIFRQRRRDREIASLCVLDDWIQCNS